MTRSLPGSQLAILLAIGTVGLAIAFIPAAVPWATSLGASALFVTLAAIALITSRNAQPRGSLEPMVYATDHPRTADLAVDPRSTGAAPGELR